MLLNIKRTTYPEAREISKWTYRDQYSIYGMDGTDSCINELTNDLYFSVTNEKNKLLGYYCFGEAAQVPAGRKHRAYMKKNFIDIGLALSPTLCGKGLGFDFLNSGLDFAREHFSARDFRLTVAVFNKRAIKVYEKVGFKKFSTFKATSNAVEMEFLVMLLRAT